MTWKKKSSTQMEPDNQYWWGKNEGLHDNQQTAFEILVLTYVLTFSVSFKELQMGPHANFASWFWNRVPSSRRSKCLITGFMLSNWSLLNTSKWNGRIATILLANSGWKQKLAQSGSNTHLSKVLYPNQYWTTTPSRDHESWNNWSQIARQKPEIISD